MNKTIVQCECVSKKESKSHRVENPINTAIELEVSYNPDSIFYQMSGGTNITLNTVNKAAANMFIIGETYEIAITPVSKEEKA